MSGEVPGRHKDQRIYTIDEEFQSALRPLNLMQNIYCSPKYRIRNNTITPNGIYANIISFCGLVVLLMICICNGVINHLSNLINPFNMVLYFSGAVSNILSGIGFIINFWVSYNRSHYNVQLLLHLQAAYRLMNCSRNLRQLTVYHWTNLILLYGGSIAVCSYFHFTYQHPNAQNSIYAVIVLCFDVNIIYSISMIKIIRNSLVHWYQEISKRRRLRNAFVYNEELFDAYRHIMLAYENFKKAFHDLILFHTINTFFGALVNVQTIIVISKVQPELQISILMTLALLCPLLLKNLILQMTLGIESEKFYIQVRKVQSTCIIGVSTTDHIDMKIFYKNIIRLNKATFKKLDTCGLFTVDAGSTLRLFKSIATYTIVLLQFAYL